MKVIRGLYVWTMYILPAPLMLIGCLVLFVYGYAVARVKYHIKPDVRETLWAIKEGVKVGHRINMNFVKYGRKGMEYGFMKEAE